MTNQKKSEPETHQLLNLQKKIQVRVTSTNTETLITLASSEEIGCKTLTNHGKTRPDS